MLNHSLVNRRRFFFAWLGAIGLLILVGICYRTLAIRLHQIVQSPVELPVGLGEFPYRLYDWQGRDVAISETVQKVAGNDDFLSRHYFNSRIQRGVSVYIAYSARPRNMLGHRPEVCYVGAGWVHDSTDHTEVISRYGTLVPCLLHRFHKPAGRREEIVVLNFYILNGRFTADEKGFSGLSWRMPNIEGDPARYVAQVQISSSLEEPVRLMAVDFVDKIIEFMPAQNGNVK